MGTSRRRTGQRTGRLVAVAAALATTLTLTSAPVGATPPEPAAVQPDAIIVGANGGTVVGDNVYNTTGANQTKTRTVARGSTFVALFRAQNDSPDLRFLTPIGCASNANFTVKYFLPQAPNPDIDVTQSITSGALSVGRNPGQSETYRVVIKVKAAAAAGATLTCRLKVRINAKGPDDPVDVARIVIHRA